MGFIYHYCSLNIFVQIISNKTIRLSNLDKTNNYIKKELHELMGILGVEIEIGKENELVLRPIQY